MILGSSIPAPGTSQLLWGAALCVKTKLQQEGDLPSSTAFILQVATSTDHKKNTLSFTAQNQTNTDGVRK